jgi:hypothetical protein
VPSHTPYFKILGLDAPPEDRKAVKRAYSRMLKVTRPEDDPDGFMRLRDAHDQALNILKWQAEEREWEAKQAAPQPAQEPAPEPAANVSIEDTPAPEMPPPETTAPPAPTLTYSDMLPETEPEPEVAPEPDTSYSIGPTPNLDAPFIQPVFSEPAAKPLIETLEAMLETPKRYNDREEWNLLFRKARELDIDDYVDFENALLESILRFHGYFSDHPHHDTPQKMPLKLSLSIAASLFKTMSWDQVNTRGQYRGNQIDWLERRMQLRKRGVDPAPIPQNTSSGGGNVWLWIFGAFVILKIIQALANL